MNPDGTIEKFKVRLVALGSHQKYGETFSETYAPETQLSSSRLILYLTLKKNLELKHMNVRTAYLQSKLTGDRSRRHLGSTTFWIQVNKWERVR